MKRKMGNAAKTRFEQKPAFLQRNSFDFVPLRALWHYEARNNLSA